MKKYFLTLLPGKKNKGFTLFIALIVSSILLSIGYSIGNIILKQLQLSTSGKESQVAFYAADSAAECALYWDRKDVNGESVVDVTYGTSTAELPTYIKCGSGADGQGTVHVASKNIDPNTNSATTTFYIDFQDITGYGYSSCAKVTVGRNGNNTSIQSRGYNSRFDPATEVCDITNPRTVERGLLLLY
ncbi:MAG: pilus assembly PilX N-terminal domain-containing protein [Patescibacteria group bacterium]